MKMKNTRHHKKYILIIDDSNAVREALWRILNDHFKVFLASSAWEGLKMLSRDIDLVFLDLILPDLNGLEVLRQIKTEHPSIPVVIITGYSTEQTCINAFRIGARDYIKKPFNDDEILQKAELLTNIFVAQKRRPISLSENNVKDDYSHKDIPSHILRGIMEVKDYIDKNLTNPLDLSDASRMAGINRTYFAKYFKLATCCTFKDYIDTIRLERARDLLENKDIKIADIAESVGYTPKHFSEVFKKAYGIPPSKLKN
jgi:YesN/AraC family two-component response regulator